MRKDQVLKLVRQKLADVDLGSIALDVVGSAERTKDDFWYVPVRPSSVPPRTIEFYDVLAEVETELSLKHRLKVLLVPAMPEDNGEGSRPKRVLPT